jgi:aerobic C4-dicarboxylate transport protein
MKTQEELATATSTLPAGSRWYRGLGAQVLVAMALGIAVGFAAPGWSAHLKILGDLFLSLIKAGIAPLVFFTVVLGITAAGNLKRASRIGVLALIYFEIVSTIALLLGLLAGNLLPVGRNAAALTTNPGAAPGPDSHQHGIGAFLQSIVPDNFIGAFSSGQLLQVVVLAVLFGAGLLTLRVHVQQKVNTALELTSETFFGFINVVMRLAPIGAFGAIAYSVGTNGHAMLIALTELVIEYWVVVAVFIAVVLGLVCLLAGFNVLRLLQYVWDEMALVLGTASSESALPGLLRKLPRLGLSKQSVGLVVPTGYAFNLDGTAIYMAICTLFLARAYNIPMGLSQQLELLLIMLLTSKGAATVSGGTFVVFASTIAATGYLPVSGVAILFGVYRFMSIATAFCNTFGNVVANVVLAKWSKEMDVTAVRRILANPRSFLAQDSTDRSEPVSTAITK